MFELSVEKSFRASHALLLGGEREDLHEHDWGVRVTVEGSRLDGDGLLVDFHALERELEEVISPLRGCDLNAAPALRGVNPSAENVAVYIARALLERISGTGWGSAVALRSVRVVEAPGCAVEYRVSGCARGAGGEAR